MKKRLFRSTALCLLLSVLTFNSCKKDEAEHPEIQTLSAVALSATKLVLKGNIVRKGNFPVKDYGFVFSNSSYTGETDGIKVSLGADAPEGEFSKEVSTILTQGLYGNVVFVRAYLTNERGTAYGSTISVTLPTPTASLLTPNKGKAGDRITITGELLTDNQSDVKVFFGEMAAKIVEFSSSKVVVEVPTGISGNHNSVIYVRLRIGNREHPLSNNFVIQASFLDFSPKSGPVGTRISFTGYNLPSYYYSSTSDVKFYINDQEVNNGYYSDSPGINIPATATTESLKLSVIANGVKMELPGEFKITPPVITSVSKTSAPAGSSLNLQVSNMISGYSPVVKLGTRTIGGEFYSGTINAYVPDDMEPGEYKLTLTTGPHTVEAPTTVKVIEPTIESISPTRGPVGTQVTIRGNFKSSQSINVKFGSAISNAWVSSESTLITYVPNGLEAGNVKVSVMFPNKTVTARDEFTITTPKITSFSPSSGVAGTVVTIEGEGFNPNNMGVKFGTIDVPWISATESRIKVQVPSNVNPGAMKLSVLMNGQVVATSNADFTITK